MIHHSASLIAIAMELFTCCSRILAIIIIIHHRAILTTNRRLPPCCFHPLRWTPGVSCSQSTRQTWRAYSPSSINQRNSSRLVRSAGYQNSTLVSRFTKQRNIRPRLTTRTRHDAAGSFADLKGAADSVLCYYKDNELAKILEAELRPEQRFGLSLPEDLRPLWHVANNDCGAFATPRYQLHLRTHRSHVVDIQNVCTDPITFCTISRHVHTQTLRCTLAAHTTLGLHRWSAEETLINRLDNPDCDMQVVGLPFRAITGGALSLLCVTLAIRARCEAIVGDHPLPRASAQAGLLRASPSFRGRCLPSSATAVRRRRQRSSEGEEVLP